VQLDWPLVGVHLLSCRRSRTTVFIKPWLTKISSLSQLVSSTNTWKSVGDSLAITQPLYNGLARYATSVTMYACSIQKVALVPMVWKSDL
jgi:hypothetical protein